MEHPACNQVSAPVPAKARGTAVIYVMTVFLGAFLLFQVQPLIGKYILPWFGGGPEVWTTCMMFFQMLLLAGYAYAHFLSSRLGAGRQAAVHIALLAAALLALPIIPRATWRPESLYNPVVQILLLAGICVGLPYFVLSSTGPLIQRWFSQTHPDRTAYRLYAFSNAGSLIGLVSYPFVFEPTLSRQVQAKVWSAGMVVFAVLCASCAIAFWRHRNSTAGQIDPDSMGEQQAPPSIGRRLLWLGLPAAASVELLAVTNKLCLDIAAIPFLWVLPLSLYLLSFIICFDRQRWYVRPVFLTAFLLAMAGVGIANVYERDISAWHQIAIYSALLFMCCMVCHGELYRIRPQAKYLTHYYLMIAVGGALGGVFVAIIAPLIFTSYRELYVGLLVCCLFVLLADKSRMISGRRRWIYVVLVLLGGVAAIFLDTQQGQGDKTAVLKRRNFFGVSTIWQQGQPDTSEHAYVLQHGTTIHGMQFTDPARQAQPTTYYGRLSGAGLSIDYFQKLGPTRMGIVGLGVGTLATYGRKGDYIQFYEINPEVTRLAQTWFTYLPNCRAQVEVVPGDARLSMEKEPRQGFDLLVLDAFSSDVVPVHLLTREAFEIYLRHIKPGGVIAVHISSVHLDLQAVVFTLAQHFSLKYLWIESDDDNEAGTYAADWVLVTNNKDFLEQESIYSRATDTNDIRPVMLWTDDYVNLFEIFK